MEIEEESAAVLLKLPAAYEDEPMEGGSIDDYSSHKSIREEEEEPSDSITARKKQRIIIEQEEKTKLTVDEEIVEEEEDGDDYYYDSSDSEGETEDKKKKPGVEITDEEKEKLAEPDYSELPFVDVFNDDGVAITDESFLEQMSCSNLPLHRRIKLLPKIRRYWKSIDDSQGFECEHYPGVIWGLTLVTPRQILIKQRDRYPEAYGHLMYLSKLALKDYNKKWSTEFVVLAVNNMNILMLVAYRYKITFTAASSAGSKETFQADIEFEPHGLRIEVMSCDIKTNPTHSDSFLGEEPSDKSIAGNEILDPVETISTLMRLGDDELLDKIKNNCPPAMNQDMLLKKVRKYFQSVVESEGYKCSYFPAHIPSITYLRPREKLFYNMNCHVEGYHHLTIMSQLALDYYFKDKGSEHGYLVARVTNATLWERSNCSYTYYLTFVAAIRVSNPESGIPWQLDHRYVHENFKAKVHDNHHDIIVLFCTKLGH